MQRALPSPAIRPLLAALALSMLTLIGLGPLAAPARAGVPDIGDDINAKIARFKSQRGAGGATDGKTISKIDERGADGCSIALGNIFEEPKSGSLSTTAKKETTVVVQGDIIMAGNRCK